MEASAGPENAGHRGGAGGEVVLLLADISGYTRFMLANRTEMAHGQGIITDLLQAVIRQLEIPMEVHKFEGDAVFITAEFGGAQTWGETGRLIGRKLHAFIEAFDAALLNLARSNACHCGACDNMAKLTLNVIAHKGIALRYRIGRFEELSGADVILVHRLLKNSVPGTKYLLVTEAAFGFLRLGDDFKRAVERYDDVGEIPVRYKLLAPLSGLEEHPSNRMNLGDSLRKMRYGARYLFTRKR